jgi:hypothetical protein
LVTANFFIDIWLGLALIISNTTANVCDNV